MLELTSIPLLSFMFILLPNQDSGILSFCILRTLCQAPVGPPITQLISTPTKLPIAQAQHNQPTHWERQGTNPPDMQASPTSPSQPPAPRGCALLRISCQGGRGSFASTSTWCPRRSAVASPPQEGKACSQGVREVGAKS